MAKNEDMSPLERIKQLDEERAKLLEEAKKEALNNATQAVSALNALGFKYQLTEEADGSRPGKSSGAGNRMGTRTVKPGTICPICKFATNPPHDGRRHPRKEPKRPFTDDELQAMGMRRM